MHHHHWNRDERACWHFAGRGGGPGSWGRGPRGRGGGWGGGAFRVGKMLADGDLRLIVLALLDEGAAPRLRDHQGARGEVERHLQPLARRRLSDADLSRGGWLRHLGQRRIQEGLLDHRGRPHAPAENRELADMALSGIEKFGRKMAQARTWWESQRRDGRTPDRDIPGVIDAVNEARRELKAAIAEKLDASEDEQRRVADILRKAADAIRKVSSRQGHRRYRSRLTTSDVARGRSLS